MLVLMLVLVAMRVAVRVAVRVLVQVCVGFWRRAVIVHDEMSRRYARAQHLRRTHGVAGHGQASERRAEVVEREPGVEEGSDDHVAGDARKGVEIQHA